MIPPCLTLSIIRCGSRVKWSNPGNGVAPSPTPWCSSYRKGSLRVTLDYGRKLYLLTYIYSIEFNCLQWYNLAWGVAHGVMFKALDCRILVCEFVLQSRYYIHFQANTLGKGMNPPYPPSYALNSTTSVLLERWLWH